MHDSVSHISDSSGNIIQRYDYSAFGNIFNESGSFDSELKFQDKESLGDFGLVFYGARYYKPSIGRFITPDPAGMADGPNMYLFCLNDPVNLIDPYGLSAILPPESGDTGGGTGGINGTPGVPESGVDWGQVHGKNISAQPGAAQINAGGCGGKAGGGANYKQNGTPQNNQKQNRIFRDAVDKIRRLLGRPLFKDEIRRLHEAISKQNYNYHKIVEEGLNMFGK